MRECALKANGDLPWRPIALQVLRYPVSEPRVSRQQAQLRPPATPPSLRIGIGGPVSASAAVSLDLAAYR